MSEPPLLSLQGVVRDHAGGLLNRSRPRRALDGVTLDVSKGRIVGIVGESGSGKSTLARLAAGLDTPTAGQILMRGEDLRSLSRSRRNERRRDVQMVFQDPFGSLDPRHSIGRIVAEPLHLIEPRLSRSARHDLAREALASVGLGPEVADRRPHEFSGGQRQRIAIARAVVTKPALVVADEPVSALDLSAQAQILNLVADLRNHHGIAFLFVSHDLEVVHAICDDVAVMYAGRIVEMGDADRVMRHPAHPYTRRLTDTGLAREGTSSVTDGSVSPFPADRVDWRGCAYRASCARADATCRTVAPVLAPGDRLSFGRQVACHHPEP